MYTMNDFDVALFEAHSCRYGLERYYWTKLVRVFEGLSSFDRNKATELYCLFLDSLGTKDRENLNRWLKEA